MLSVTLLLSIILYRPPTQAGSAALAPSLTKILDDAPMPSPCSKTHLSPHFIAPALPSTPASAQFDVPVALSSLIPNRGAKLRTFQQFLGVRTQTCTPTASRSLLRELIRRKSGARESRVSSCFSATMMSHNPVEARQGKNRASSRSSSATNGATN